MKINNIPYSHLLAVLRAEEAGKDIVHQADGAHIYAMDSVGELHELGWVDSWLSPSDFQSAVDHVKFCGQDRPPISLADLIDAENPPQMYCVPGSKGFKRKICRRIRANHQTTESALHAVAHAVPFEDSSLNIAQILAIGLNSLPENDESREWMENAVGICLGAIVEAANRQTPDHTAPTPET